MYHIGFTYPQFTDKEILPLSQNPQGPALRFLVGVTWVRPQDSGETRTLKRSHPRMWTLSLNQNPQGSALRFLVGVTWVRPQDGGGTRTLMRSHSRM